MPKSETAKPEQIESTPEKVAFQVVYENVVLSTVNIGDARTKVTSGDVARLSDGTMVARVTGRDADGETIFAYEPWSSDPVTRGNFAAIPRRDSNDFENVLQSLGYTGTLSQSDLRAEIDRFKKEYPEIVKILDIERDNPAPIFNPGPVYYPTNPNAPFWFDAGRSRPLIDLYAAGQWGNWGVADLSPLTAEERWLASSLPRLRRNVAAIFVGSGIVKAQYPLQPHLQSQWDQHFPDRHLIPKAGAIEFMTLVRPSGNKTIARTVFATES
jgi:hypothetical protein